MEQLSRSDIVAQKVVQVWQTPWAVKDGWSSCRTFVELSNGVSFELVGQESLQEPPPPIYRIELHRLGEIIPAQYVEGAYCNGRSVCEVVETDMWPTLGLLLSSRDFLLATAYTDGVFGPALFTVGEFYKLEDAVTYWGHKPLTSAIFANCN